jgi:hypothetical protein
VAEQDRRGIDAPASCSHDANNRNHIENIGQSVDVGPAPTTSPSRTTRSCAADRTSR